jgi:hypothetical protein
MADTPAPPDLQAQLEMMRYRAHVAEMVLYKTEESLVALLKGFQPMVRQMHELNKQFPLGDESIESAASIAANAVKHLPEYAGLTSDQIIAKLGGKA